MTALFLDGALGATRLPAVNRTTLSSEIEQNGKREIFPNDLLPGGYLKILFN